MKILRLLLSICLASSLTGCTSSITGIEKRFDLADHISQSSLPIQETLSAGTLNITGRARITRPDQPARVYIEGDGLAWKNKYTPSNNPTPTNPVALRLASIDPSPNVIWLARPCQYEGFLPDCSRAYWTNKRFAPEVISAYQNVLDQLKIQYGFQTFELVGFSGGAAIAVIVAAQRSDILSIRTVAGNLDHETLNRIHRVSPMPESLNPHDFAQRISHIPQVHFIGKKDMIVTAEVYDSFAAAMMKDSCTAKISTNASHTDGWDNIWPELLSKHPVCR